MVKRVKALRDDMGLKFVIVGVGGITKPEDYDEYRAAGADAAMSATGAMWNPLLAQEIKSRS
jgi:dihydroorotate dehydrogenase